MPRPPRDLQPGYCYHITTRCNNRDFLLCRGRCRELLLSAVRKAREKFGFKLYALCIMTGHVHYLLDPAEPEDLPRIMHWLNWYTAMCFNRMQGRTGHFWEQRYYSSGFPRDDRWRALNTLRYIHANPQAAGMRRGMFYCFSNYGSYEKLSEDGLTQWHPAFLEVAQTLDDCAAWYAAFCRRYKPRSKPRGRSHWGSRLLDGLKVQRRKRNASGKGQKYLWPPLFGGGQRCQVSAGEILLQTAQRFVKANAHSPAWAAG